ncbi:MAG: 2-oxoglutarate and iron-dependent oxygenase domain-containing protein [Sneathiellaceae bacterium]
MGEIPVIDLGPYFSGGAAGKAKVAAAVDRACTDIGFLIVTGHGVPAALVEDMRATSRRFFDLPMDAKMAYKMPDDRYRGYTAYGGEALSYSLGDESPPDLKEGFSIGPCDTAQDAYHAAGGTFFAPNMWPPEMPELRPVWTRYYGAMEGLATDLMRIFALGLGMDEHYFDDKVDRHITNFTAMHYPPVTGEVLPNQLRGGAHTDYGSLTIVQRDDSPGGLQVQDKSGAWIDAPYIPDSFVINLGDLMAEWTNDRWVSTLHRVVPPPPQAAATADRMSLLFFHQPNYDARIEVLPTCTGPDNPPRYGNTTSGEHVMEKIRRHRMPGLESAAE